jgi:hypothetical protein
MIRTQSRIVPMMYMFAVICLFSCSQVVAEAGGSLSAFPVYLRDGFDYAGFARFDAPSPPADRIYQSNGFLELKETAFGGQEISIPVKGSPAPDNESDRVLAVVVDAPRFLDAEGNSYTFDDATGQRSVTYFADRTVYRVRFASGLSASLEVYPVYGKSAAVCRLTIDASKGAVRVLWSLHGAGLQGVADTTSEIAYGSQKWPYRVLLGTVPSSVPQMERYEWQLRAGQSAALLVAVGGSAQEARASLSELRKSTDLMSASTHRRWNEYLGSVPLVAPANSIHYTVATSGRHFTIAPEELVRSELWFWRGVLTNTCQTRYLPATPITIADWNVFFGMWGNDGVEEAVALSGTNRKDIARGALLNWFRYAVNRNGDGSAAWTIFPSGHSTYEARGPEHATESVNLQASLVGEYVRLTGDAGVLDEKLGGAAGDRTLWQALVVYESKLLSQRNPHKDLLIEWLHTYETGWDDKNSPFVDLKGHATAAINEQVFNLWSLSEMAFLARARHEDPAPWTSQFSAALDSTRSRLWDPATERYWDLDEETGKLWTSAENLDAYYLLFYENDPARIAAMLKRFRDPAKFNGFLLPTMAFDTPNWGGYWCGPAWPREFGYVAMGLARAGYSQEGFDWLARGVHTNLGPILPETVDPKADRPDPQPAGWVRIMGYDTLSAFLLPEVAGLRTWSVDDLTVLPSALPGKLYIREQKWMGDRYDALLERGHPTILWRNEKQLPRLAGNRTWHAQKSGDEVTFSAEPQKTSGRK